MARATCGDVPQRNRLALCLVQFFFVDLSERQKPNFPALNKNQILWLEMPRLV
jgi:hypothetical protein